MSAAQWRFTTKHVSMIRVVVAYQTLAYPDGGEHSSPLTGLTTKMQNKKNSTFLALLRMSFAVEQTQKMI